MPGFGTTALNAQLIRANEEALSRNKLKLVIFVIWALTIGVMLVLIGIRRDTSNDLDKTTFGKLSHVEITSHESPRSLATFRPLQMMHARLSTSLRRSYRVGQAAMRSPEQARAEWHVVHVTSVIEAPKTRQRQVNPEGQRLIQMQSKEMQDKMKMLKADAELKPLFDKTENGGPAVMIKYPELLSKVGERLSKVQRVGPIDELHLLKLGDATNSSHSAIDVTTRTVDDGGRAEGILLMLTITMLWGSNFPAVKAVSDIGFSESFNAAARFSIAALALLPMLGDPRRLPSELTRGGLYCGMWLAAGYIAQALALHDLPAGTVAFIVSLQVVIVPLAQTCRGGTFTPRLALAALLCIGGVGLLESGGMGSVAGGAAAAAPNALLGATLLAFVQPVAFSASNLINKDMMQKFPSCGPQLSALQLLSNAAGTIVWYALDTSGVFGGGAANGGEGIDLGALQQPAVIAGILWTGLISTALTIPLQTRALGKLPVTDSTMIVATEPLWAAGFASVLLGEHLEKTAILGGGLILLGCVCNTLFPTDLGTGIEDTFAPGKVRILRAAKEGELAYPTVEAKYPWIKLSKLTYPQVNLDYFQANRSTF
eukprot:gnl/TRDRNA2_/TRDRNA2_39811_c0_seq1.p1 gnl/TRDRNA2_/TRDRNA2_39811_c0~~gnl/TRDRNA2_/TRDRNA2_39811_c0_seq1.p1  ORF type:complete len:599 (+),score=107.98 gnl/TRDRNA2_/TRDRNA2_39811_c0_seq1:38-1834(+)